MILKDKHIFIVEDNMQNRVIFQMALIRHGAIVDFERRGRETMTRLGDLSSVDLIILDLMLAEGVSGFDLYDEIRAVPKFASVPIVAVSAMDPGMAIPKTLSKGFAGFIAKPIDNHLFPKQLVRIIEGEQIWYGGERYVS
jgi:CheY-like chemotaxis protein